jgi:hypothetical protein
MRNFLYQRDYERSWLHKTQLQYATFSYMLYIVRCFSILVPSELAKEMPPYNNP